jgi:hypothetical protein
LGYFQSPKSNRGLDALSFTIFKTIILHVTFFNVSLVGLDVDAASNW